MLNSDDFVSVLNKHENTILFYAKEEAFNTIPSNVLDKIHNKEYVNGLHECFNDSDTCKGFFDKLLQYI
jgi:hypothetical protein